MTKIILTLGLFMYCTCGAAMTPQLGLNSDEICSIYFDSYQQQLAKGAKPSFLTNEIISQQDNTIITANSGKISPISFTTPLIHEKISWLKWQPIETLDQDFSWGGMATQVTAVATSSLNENELLVLSVYTIGWRGPFYQIWRINRKALTELIAKHKKTDETLAFNNSDAQLIYPPSNMHSTSFSNLLYFNNHFYVLSDNEVLKYSQGQFAPVCDIGVASKFSSPDLDALVAVANNSLMTKGVQHIPMYYGSMGNRHRAVVNGFNNAVHRPWLLRVNPDGSCMNNAHSNSCLLRQQVDAILAQFASSDPWSYREVAALRHHIDAAQQALADYYKAQFGLDEVAANGTATQAIYEFLAKTVYLHSYLSLSKVPAVTVVDPYLDNSTRLPNWYQKTPLMWAAHFNDYDEIKALLEQGADVNALTHSADDYASIQQLNRSALLYAAENATYPVMQLLLEAGADINVKDSKGNGIDHYLAKNILVTGGLSAVNTNLQIKPSFDCALAKTAHEKAICQNLGLQVYDSQLDALYKRVLADNKYNNIKALQRNWLKQTKSVCASARANELLVCLKQRYRARIKYLSDLVLLAN